MKVIFIGPEFYFYTCGMNLFSKLFLICKFIREWSKGKERIMKFVCRFISTFYFKIVKLDSLRKCHLELKFKKVHTYLSQVYNPRITLFK